MALRAINTAGSAPSSNIVNGVDLGAADAGYTTLSAAYAAGSSGDTFVITDAIDATLTGANYTVSYDHRLTCTDAVRSDRKDYDTSFARVNHNASLIFSSATGTYVVENIGRRSSTGAAFDNTGAAANVFSRVHGRTISAQTFLLGRSSTDIKCDNNCIEMADGSATNCAYIWNFSSGDRAVKSFNDFIIITNDTTTHSYVFRGQSGSQRIDVVNAWSVEAPGATAPTSSHFFNCVAHASYAAGNNGSSDTSSPGTTTYDNVTADDITSMTDNDPANVDFHYKDRATAESYPGSDVSAEVYVADLDADNEERGDEWFVGADWIAGASAGTAWHQRKSGYHSSYGTFGRMG